MTAHHTKPVPKVVIIGYPGVTLMDVSGPMQVFSSARRASYPAYEVTFASAEGGPIETDVGVQLASRRIDQLEQWSIDTVLIAGGEGVFAAMEDRDLLDWILKKRACVRRIGSTCMGTFVLGAAGLTKGRRVTTHWRWANSLKKRFPDVDVHSDAIYVNDREIWSSAGVSAGIDMALAMVEEDLGHGEALEIARGLVVPLKRSGGQSQFSAALEMQTADREGRLDHLHAWIMDNLESDLSVERLAQVYGRSTRTFLRHYKAATGMTPAKAVEGVRVEAARALLEQGSNHISVVARRCGFDHIETMRRSFVRCLGVSPSEYRGLFGKRSGYVDSGPKETVHPVVRPHQADPDTVIVTDD